MPKKTVPRAVAVFVVWLALTLAAPVARAYTVANPYSTGFTSLKIGTLTVFGDSYSANLSSFHQWPYQFLLEDKQVARLKNFAKSGARAASIGSNYFAIQVKNWLATNPTFAANDLTIIFLGYNDISDNNLAQAKTDFVAQLKTILGKGANGGNRRVFVVMPHDRGGDPNEIAVGTSAATRQLTLQWRAFISDTVKLYPHVIAVDLLTAIDQVVRNPGAFGFTNVTEANAELSKTTYLYWNGGHFGYHGQKLIKLLIRYYLTRGWDWSNTLTTRDAMTTQLQQDINAGLVFPHQ